MQRITRQRAAIIKCLSQEGRPLAIDEILESATKESPQINLSTVYRNLKILIEHRKVSLVNLPGDRVCYEIIQKEHHHYFTCDECHKTYPVNACPKGLLEMVPKGFRLSGHSITLNGFCEQCT